MNRMNLNRSDNTETPVSAERQALDEFFTKVDSEVERYINADSFDGVARAFRAASVLESIHKRVLEYAGHNAALN